MWGFLKSQPNLLYTERKIGWALVKKIMLILQDAVRIENEIISIQQLFRKREIIKYN